MWTVRSLLLLLFATLCGATASVVLVDGRFIVDRWRSSPAARRLELSWPTG